MEYESEQEKIVLPEELQKKILKFFLKTSIPRKLRQEKMNKTLSEKERKEENANSDICTS